MRFHSPLLLLSLGACSLPGLTSPRFYLEPQWSLLELRGDTSMQSTSSGSVVDNPAIDAREFGLDHHAGNWGVKVSVGDDFSGFDASYLNVENTNTRRGTLPADWGDMRTGDRALMNVTGDEWRLAYFGEVWDTEIKRDVTLRVAPGLALTHRDLKLEAKEETSSTRRQVVHIAEEVTPYAALRVRVAWRNFDLDVDYGINPDLHFGGDYDGVMQDYEVRGRYRLEDQDLAFVAGYRHSDITASGSEGGLRWETDFAFEGWFFGVRFGF